MILADIESEIAEREREVTLSRARLTRARSALTRARGRASVREARSRVRLAKRELAEAWTRLNCAEDRYILAHRVVYAPVEALPTAVVPAPPTAVVPAPTAVVPAGLSFADRLRAIGAQVTPLGGGRYHGFWVVARAQRMDSGVDVGIGEMLNVEDIEPLDMVAVLRTLEQNLADIAPYPTGMAEYETTQKVGLRLRLEVYFGSGDYLQMLSLEGYEKGDVSPFEEFDERGSRLVLSGWHRTPIRLSSTLDLMWSDLEGEDTWKVTAVAVEIVYSESAAIPASDLPYGEVV